MVDFLIPLLKQTNKWIYGNHGEKKRFITECDLAIAIVLIGVIAAFVFWLIFSIFITKFTYPRILSNNNCIYWPTFEDMWLSLQTISID